MALIFGLYRSSSGPIAFRNVFKCSTSHTFFTIRFWHFSSAAFIEKNAERVLMASWNNFGSIYFTLDFGGHTASMDDVEATWDVCQHQ